MRHLLISKIDNFQRSLKFEFSIVVFVQNSRSQFQNELTQPTEFREIDFVNKMSTLFFIWTCLVSVIIQTSQAIHSLQGKVDGGNYSYYVLKYEGPIFLELRSIEGDADLYISEKFDHPTFDLDEHSMSSWTCGTDSLFIPKSFGRPINIGVYGHPRYETSRFVLTAVFHPDDEIDPFANELHEPLGKDSAHEDVQDHDQEEEKYNFSRALRTTLYWILEILVEILTSL